MDLVALGELLNKLLFFVIALGLLVTAHEFGHYWVARRAGIKILRFSVGFGRPLWRRQRGETEFVLAAVPLGGYVKMLDEREAPVADAELPRAFNRQSLAVRSAVVVAGPVANFVFALAAYWLMLVVGVQGPRALVGEVEPGSVAARAGLAADSEIVAVDGSPTATWDGFLRKALGAILEDGSLRLTVRDAAGGEREALLDFSGVSIDAVGEGEFFDTLGLQPWRPHIAAVIGELVPGEPAERAGLLPGDRVIAVDGAPVADWLGWVERVQASPGLVLAVEVERRGERLTLDLRPAAAEADGRTIGRIGAQVQGPLPPVPLGTERYGPLAALAGAGERTLDLTVTTLRFLYKMVTLQVSPRNLSGPLSIAHYAGESAKLGFARFVEFLALVSVSLAVLNLLPIPLLDGGHLLYYLIESVTRRPVPEQAQAIGQQVGLMLLLGLMGLAMYQDILRML